MNMLPGTFRVERLRGNEVTDQVVDDINVLLLKQRQDARHMTIPSLLEKMERMGVVVAWNDKERVVGLGVLTQGEGLNFECAEIRHMVILDGLDCLAIGARIEEALREIYLHGIQYIDAGAWVQDGAMRDVFRARGYKEKPASRFRLRIKKSA